MVFIRHLQQLAKKVNKPVIVEVAMQFNAIRGNMW